VGRERSRDSDRVTLASGLVAVCRCRCRGVRWSFRVGPERSYDSARVTLARGPMGGVAVAVSRSAVIVPSGTWALVRQPPRPARACADGRGGGDGVAECGDRSEWDLSARTTAPASRSRVRRWAVTVGRWRCRGLRWSFRVGP